MKIEIENIKSLEWYVPLELNHSSYIYTSLLEFIKKYDIKITLSNVNLNRKGKLKIQENTIQSDNSWFSKVSFVKFYLNDGNQQLLAFDCSDSPYEFPRYAFENADIVFKRSFIGENIKLLPEQYQQKIRPMGLPFMVRPDAFYFKNKIKLLYFLFRFKQLIKLDRLIFDRLKNYYKGSINHWNNFSKSRCLKDFNDYTRVEKSDQIFYQKRLFPNESNKDTKEIHQQRIGLIRLLKKEFPNHFIGGLKYDPPLTDNYADCISNIEGDPHSFLDALRSCGIGIYTRGLTLSTGWTLPEYLSQNKCVVAEKSNTIFPQPLEHNVHLMYYHTEKELIAICKYLIDNKGERDRIAKNGFDYYNQFINPTGFFEYLLKLK